MRQITLPLIAALALGCQGRIGDTELEDGNGPGSGEDTQIAFELPDQQPQLLPFWVRLERVVSVVGQPIDDPMFDLLHQNRLALGDYDYASGVKPDRMWNPSRMALWAKSLKPVCASEAMHSLYPNLATDGGDVVILAGDAWGREVTTEELDIDVPSLQALGEADRYEAVCLGILSSAEFVIQ